MTVTVDGVELFNDVVSVPDWAGVHRITFGKRDPGGFTHWDNFYHGDLAEIIFYDQDISAASRWELNKYLGEKYGGDVALEPPVFNQSSQVAGGSLDVELTSGSPEASLYYTIGSDANIAEPALDGSGNPTGNTLLYTGPITVSSSSTIKAKSFAHGSGYQPSPLVTRSFVIDAGANEVARNGLQLWLMGDAGVESDGSNAISVWRDLSGLDKVALQSTTAKQPHTATAINSKPTVNFDGGDALRVDVVEGADFSIFTVFKTSGAGILYELSPDTNSGNGLYLLNNINATSQH